MKNWDITEDSSEKWEDEILEACLRCEIEGKDFSGCQKCPHAWDTTIVRRRTEFSGSNS